jgi:hypothetical protein
MITRSSELVNVTPLCVTEGSFCCALFRFFIARVRYNIEQRVFFMIFMWEGGGHTNHPGENFAINFGSSNPWHFN